MREEMLTNLQTTAVIIKETEELIDESDKYTHKITINLGWRFITYLILLFITYTIINSLPNNIVNDLVIFFVIAFFVVPYLVMRFTFTFICNLYHSHKQKKYKSRLIKIEEKLKQNINLLQNDSILPKAYWNSFAVAKIIDYIRNLRADNLKEAINLFENELKHIEQIEKIDKMQENIISQLSKVKNSARSAEFASWVNFLSK